MSEELQKYAEKPMELETWGGDWGLPSIDYRCLQVMALIKFSGCPVKLHKTNNPLPRSLPCLSRCSADPAARVHSFFETAHFLRKQKFHTDYELTRKDKADALAYIKLIEEKLSPALTYLWWVDNRNYIEVVRPWYAGALPFPLNYYYPGAYQRDAYNYFKATYPYLLGDEDDWTEVENLVHKNACECLSLLSTKLGEKEWFLGRAPCSVDAFVFGAIAPLLKVPLTSQALTNHLRACPNLTTFVIKILQRYFPPTPEEMEESRKKAEEEKAKREFDGDIPYKRLKQVASGLFAGAAMVGYAYMSGLLQIEVKPRSLEDQDDEDVEEYEEFIRGNSRDRD